MMRMACMPGVQVHAHGSDLALVQLMSATQFTAFVKTGFDFQDGIMC